MKTLFLTIICSVAVAPVVALPKQLQQSGISADKIAVKICHDSSTLQPIGEIDGKMYYLENVYLPWQESLQHCVNVNGMDLASITTKHQMDFLKQAFNNMTGDFWTSGRDARAARQHVYNHTGEALDPEVIRFASSPWYQTCLVLRAAPNNGSKIHGVHCETNRNQPICEHNLF